MITAFFIGLFSTVHCLGMCGGMVGAMTMSLKPNIRNNPLYLGVYTFFYNFGRISSYALMGLLFGLFGQIIRDALLPENGLVVMRTITSLLIIAMGFFIAGWFPQFSRIEKIGIPVWRFLQPMSERLLPVRNIWQAFLFGAVWGWLPCGLVYYALLMSPGNDGAINSALFMFFFGLGTMTPMIAAGFVVGKFTRFKNSNNLRIASGLLLILMGFIGMYLALKPEIRHQLHFYPY